MLHRFAGRRFSRLVIGALMPLAIALSSTPVLGANVGGGCGDDASGWARVSLDGWWTKTVEVGFGGDVDAAISTLAPLLGVDATLDAVRDAIIDGVAGVDANDDQTICWKRLPTTRGIPSYIFNVKDDAAVG